MIKLYSFEVRKQFTSKPKEELSSDNYSVIYISNDAVIYDTQNIVFVAKKEIHFSEKKKIAENKILKREKQKVKQHLPSVVRKADIFFLPSKETSTFSDHLEFGKNFISQISNYHYKAIYSESLVILSKNGHVQKNDDFYNNKNFILVGFNYSQPIRPPPSLHLQFI